MSGLQENLGQRLNAAGKRIIDSPKGEMGPALVAELLQIIGAQFLVENGTIADRTGHERAIFAALIRDEAKPQSTQHQNADVSAGSVAVAFDVLDTLDTDGLAASCAKIAAAKAMRKAASGQSGGHFEPTLGIIFARDATVSLESLSDELERLNARTQSAYWPDLIIVLTKGHIGYSIQMVGSPTINGTLLPASLNANDGGSLPYYAVMLACATGINAFNFAMSMILGHLPRWKPGYSLDGYSSILDGIPRHGLTKAAYQPNLAGELRPITPDHYQGRSLPPKSVGLYARGTDEQLAAITMLNWQDGQVVLLKGKLPLQGMLIFFGGVIDPKVLKAIKVITSDDVQASSILPIGARQFRELLKNIQSRGGLDVRQGEEKFTVQKFADEGTRVPFIARILLAPMLLVKNLNLQTDKFVEAHQLLITTLMEIRDAAKEIDKIWTDYARKIDDGSIVIRQGRNTQITEPIDPQLGRKVSDFLTGATRSFKERIQLTARALGVEIGFLYQKRAAFERGIQELSKTDPPLAAFLVHARGWGDTLVSTRNNLDHGTWKLPRSGIQEANGRIVAIEPVIEGSRVTYWVAQMADKIISFSESIVTHAIQKHLPREIAIAEIALADRSPDNPQRFQLTVAGEQPSWEIRHHATPFDET